MAQQNFRGFPKIRGTFKGVYRKIYGSYIGIYIYMYRDLIGFRVSQNKGYHFIGVPLFRELPFAEPGDVAGFYGVGCMLSFAFFVEGICAQLSYERGSESKRCFFFELVFTGTLNPI